MRLDEHHLRLIAVGASVAVNCQPCLKTNLARARQCGVDDDELVQAIWVGRKIRRGAQSCMDEFIAGIINPGEDSINSIHEDCGCLNSNNHITEEK